MTIASAIMMVFAWALIKVANRTFDIAKQNNEEAKRFAADAEVHYNRAQLLRDEARSYYDRMEEGRQ
jgi:hypothetical protein